jgi:class 3 adenylate cyclase
MNQEIFQERIAQLRARPDADQAAIDAIERWITASNVLDRLRIHVFDIVDATGGDVWPLVAEMLQGVLIGMVDLHWDVHCPHCNMLAQEYENLADSSERGYCAMCEMGFAADFLERVEVTFSLNREIEDIALPPFFPPPRAINPQFVMDVPAHQSSSAEELVTEGVYRYCAPMTGARGVLVVNGDAHEGVQAVQISLQDGGSAFDQERLHVQPGRLHLTVNNAQAMMVQCWVSPMELPVLGMDQLPRRLSGLDIIHSPVFRSLFSDQVLSSRERLQIAAVTLLFTDITGSTRMYERLGDTIAYNIVRDHFDILFSAIEQQGGRIVKTIGDAVMASFLSSEQAFKSLVEFLHGMEAYNTARRSDEHVYLKIGVHRGAAILVNLNDRLDYFGSTVNKAARIQALSASNELSFSQEVYNDARAMRVLREAGVETMQRGKVNLKGLEGEHMVYKVDCAAIHRELTAPSRQ